MGDGYCDDTNNNIECDYDGGDCCGDNVNTNYCSVCKCLDGGSTTEGTTYPTTPPISTSSPSGIMKNTRFTQQQKSLNFLFRVFQSCLGW